MAFPQRLQQRRFASATQCPDDMESSKAAEPKTLSFPWDERKKYYAWDLHCSKQIGRMSENI